MLNSLRLFLKFIFKTPTSVDSPPLASAPQASVQVADPALRTGRTSSEVPFRLYKQNGLPPDVLVSAGLLGAGALMFAHNNHKRELNALRDEIQYIRNYQADINDQATLYEDLGERSFLELELSLSAPQQVTVFTWRKLLLLFDQIQDLLLTAKR